MGFSIKRGSQQVIFSPIAECVGTRRFFTSGPKMMQFNLHAAAYEARRKVTYPEALYLYFNSICQKHDRALDIGCGNGVSSYRLLPYFKSVEGVDRGENLIGHARTAYPNVRFTVCAAEEFRSDTSYDLITSATSFYWMEREVVLRNVRGMLARNGVFCAYKYDFPRVQGQLGHYIQEELNGKWNKFRDPRLVQYDDTIEIMRQSKIFETVQKLTEPNTIELSPEEVAGFFLSTSYVTKFLDQSKDPEYKDKFVANCRQIAATEHVLVNFDVEACVGIGIK